MHRTATTDDKKLQSTLKKLGANSIPGVEEVNFIKSDDTVQHFVNPKVQAAIGSNTFSIQGHSETRSIAQMMPGILTQLGPENLSSLRNFAASQGFG